MYLPNLKIDLHNSFRRLGLLTTGLFCLLLSVAVHGSDFRSASWGMSLNEVIALHPNQLPADRRPNYIAFDGKLAGLDVLIYYRFDEVGGLVGAGYEIATTDQSDLLVIDDFNTLNELLKKKYVNAGEPQLTWRNRIFEAKPEQWGRAVRIGHLTYQWSHSAQRTNISHTLTGNRRVISHILSYTARTEQSVEDVLGDL